MSTLELPAPQGARGGSIPGRLDKMSICPSKTFWWADGLWTPIFSVTFKLDGIDLGRYSAPTVAASFFLCFLMTERFAFSVFQDVVSFLTPVTSCSFLWGMEGEKKKFKSVSTQESEGTVLHFTIPSEPQYAHIGADASLPRASWWKKLPPKPLPRSTLRLLCRHLLPETNCSPLWHHLALPLLQMSYRPHGHPPQSLLPLRGGMERRPVEKENEMQ